MNKRMVSNLLMAPMVVSVGSIFVYCLYMLATKNLMNAVVAILAFSILILFSIGLTMSINRGYEQEGEIK